MTTNAPQTDSGKHVAALREHLQIAREHLSRIPHHLHNAASQAAVVPGCEAWAPLLEEAHDLCARAAELVAPLNLDDALGG